MPQVFGPVRRRCWLVENSEVTDLTSLSSTERRGEPRGTNSSVSLPVQLVLNRNSLVAMLERCRRELFKFNCRSPECIANCIIPPKRVAPVCLLDKGRPTNQRRTRPLMDVQFAQLFDNSKCQLLSPTRNVSALPKLKFLLGAFCVVVDICIPTPSMTLPLKAVTRSGSERYDDDVMLHSWAASPPVVS